MRGPGAGVGEAEERGGGGTAPAALELRLWGLPMLATCMARAASLALLRSVAIHEKILSTRAAQSVAIPIEEQWASYTSNNNLREELARQMSEK